ncbi:hypothetical protein [Microcoleus asticus]|uniref:Uncharacterized protein n=1 Tax=Microcoleus asticus IPMA8 TaxID=2563858 RepID=A0ABX2CUB9_9CYAN|nr:hypothetical protein [Microcoleus asticus]NQE34001.1 hypothetical protein [Microcoleus asticus IPMA8]
MSTSKTVRGSDAHNFSVVPSAELPARVAQDCQLNKADAKDLSAHSSTLTDAEALELSSLEATVYSRTELESFLGNRASFAPDPGSAPLPARLLDV